jgi:hypothetical protein
MITDDSAVRKFFEQYARGRTMRDVELIASQYVDNGARVVTKAAVLAVFPLGLERLKANGHTGTELRALESTDLDKYYRLVRAQLVWCFERSDAVRIEVPVYATFVLYVKDDVFTIVLQQEREDFRDALRTHGIVVDGT